ncbi:RNA polymerase sigma factor RpoD/SigA [Mycolicibacterium monacense]|uniref:sigma-70 family RNA polymerase sigma factor n=1 Tax=Mycolicibacterium monacense TaxID=85693 RepID=UPI0007E93A7B|nr:sigma-70 family RNA polymerase sigma factor [Mycolicibacterium monacense]OBB67097.1 hypothetical protein A6B34_20625 [Mycolicibacterium monacense]
MDAGEELVQRVVGRMRPYIRGGELKLSRLQRVLGTLKVGDSARLRGAVVARLHEQGCVVVDDTSELAKHAARPGHLERVGVRTQRMRDDALGQAIAAARRRIELDRRTRKPSKIVLTAQEEVGLATLIRGAEKKGLPSGGFGRLTGEARRAAVCLLLHNQGLVHSVAQKYAPAGMTYEDVFQHGILGLIRAVELFDPEQGNKFSTYAINWVRQGITRGIANESRLIRVPVHMVEKTGKVWRTRERLTVDGQPPTVSRLAAECGLTEDEVVECLILGPQDVVVSLDQPVGDGETTLGGLLSDRPDVETPESHLFRRSLQDQVAETLEILDAREAKVIRLRHGFDGGEPRTLEEIGGVFGVSRERIRQIEKKAITALRSGSLARTLRPYW